MPLPQRSVASFTNRDHENFARPVKNEKILPAATKTQRPVLTDIKPPNKVVATKPSNLISKKPVVVRQAVKPKTTQNVAKPEPTTKKQVNVSRCETTVRPDDSTIVYAEKISYSTSELENIADVDKDDKVDQLLVAEYVKEIYQYLQQLERLHIIEEKYLTKHQSTPRMRSIVVNWMVDVCIDFHFLQETFYLSVNILDRYLQVNKTIGRDSLQLLGVAAILIASKYEEIYVPAIKDFVYITDNSCTVGEIFKMERDILKRLQFNLGRPLSLHFLRRYSKIAWSTADQHNLAKYFLEVFLLDYDICSVHPSLQAATACCLALTVFGDKSDPAHYWSQTLEYYSSYKYSDVKPVIVKLVLAYHKMEKSSFQAIKKKYDCEKFGHISSHLKLKNLKLVPNVSKKSS